MRSVFEQVFSERKRDKRHYDHNDETLFPFRQIKNVFHFCAYLIGSVTPASRKPFKRNWQESHLPHARPSEVGS
jgi:hypothetical protein